MKDEDEAHLVEEARMKYDQEDQAHLKSEEGLRLAKYSMQESREHAHARLKV